MQQQQRQKIFTTSMKSGGGIPYPGWSYNNNVAQGAGAPFLYIGGREQAAGAASGPEGGPFYGFADLIRSGNLSPLQFPYPCGHMGGVLGAASAADRHRSLLLQQGVDVTQMTAQEIVDAKALAASRSHSEAERRRRERINNHLATLRSLLPNTAKTDKASLLAEVIQHVKELKRLASDIEQGSPVPSEADEVTVAADSEPDDGTGSKLIRASLCCDDRPDLLTDVNRTLRALRLRAVKAEMSTLGGRVKNVLVVTRPPAGGGHPREKEEAEASAPSVADIEQALKALLERQNSGELSPIAGSKRQRQVG